MATLATSRPLVPNSLRCSVKTGAQGDEDFCSYKSLDGSDDDKVRFVGGKRVRVSSVVNVDSSLEDLSVIEKTNEAEQGMIYESIY